MNKIQNRINLVLNNHLLSCHNTEHYLYIVRGFDLFKDGYNILLEKYDGTLKENTSYYVLEEDLDNHDLALFNKHKKAEVIFNFFEDNMVYLDGAIIKLDNLDIEIDDKIHIFHQIDQLNGISDTNMNNEERLNYLK